MYPPRLFSINEQYSNNSSKRDKYYALSHLWRRSLKGEVGWIVEDKDRDFKWRVTSTRRDMVLHLKDAINQIDGIDGNIKIWSDFTCVKQDDENETRTEIAISRQYYAEAEACLLCPWMGFGVSADDHLKSGDKWSTRSWPVQEIIVSKEIWIIYNKAKNGSVCWARHIVGDTEPLHEDLILVFGKKFYDSLNEVLTYRQKFNKEGRKMYIEEALRLAKNRTAYCPADLVYAYAGLSGVHQKFGRRDESTIGAVEWLYHALNMEDRIRLLVVTAKPLEHAEGAGWMPNYCSTENKLLFDSACHITETIGHVKCYEEGYGITLNKVKIFDVRIAYHTIKKECARQKYPIVFECNGNELEIFFEESQENCGIQRTGSVWGSPAPGIYTAVAVGTNLTHYVTVLCYQPHEGTDILELRKVGLLCIRIENGIIGDLSDSECKIG